MLRSTKWI